MATPNDLLALQQTDPMALQQAIRAAYLQGLGPPPKQGEADLFKYTSPEERQSMFLTPEQATQIAKSGTIPQRTKDADAQMARAQALLQGQPWQYHPSTLGNIGATVGGIGDAIAGMIQQRTALSAKDALSTQQDNAASILTNQRLKQDDLQNLANQRMAQSLAMAQALNGDAGVLHGLPQQQPAMNANPGPWASGQMGGTPLDLSALFGSY